MKRMIVVALLALVATGCAINREHKLYEGDPSQTARIVSYDTVIIKYIDNEDMGVSFIGQKQTYDVKAGQHILLLEYSDIFDVGSDDHEKIVSRPAKVTFIAEAGKQYQVRHPAQKRLDNARAFAEKPEFWVVGLPSGDKVAAEVELSRPRNFVSKLKFETTPDYEFASDAVKPVSVAAMPMTSGENTVASTPDIRAVDELSNLKMLQYSWKNASEQEKAAFLEWIKQ